MLGSAAGARITRQRRAGRRLGLAAWRPRVPAGLQRTRAARVTAIVDSDHEREKARAFRRTVFYQADWQEHRSIARYFRDVYGIDGVMNSRIVRGLLPPLGVVLVVSYLVCLYQELLGEGLLDAWVPAFPWPDLAISPDGPFASSTVALSLLLVFRTNSSYERWWEAASAWNRVVSLVSHLARQAAQWLPGRASEERRLRLAVQRWLRAFPLVLMCHQREELHKLPGLLGSVLKPDEAALVLGSAAPAQTVLAMLGGLISQSPLTRDSKTHFDEGVRGLQEALDACDKILRTPLPLSYTRHTSRFLVTWMTCLPFVAWTELGWATVPVDVILGFFLMGIEEIGVQVEEPFGILPLEHWCSVVEERVGQVQREHEAVQAAVQRFTVPAQEAAEGPHRQLPASQAPLQAQEGAAAAVAADCLRAVRN